jgi:hypothetical protein
MIIHFPQRPRTHQLETESENFFRTQLPSDWTCERPEHDYGIDLRLGLARNGQLTGEQVVVQLKASAEAPPGEDVTVLLNVSTLNFLRNMLEVAMIVKYVSIEREAYWLLLKDFTGQARNDQKKNVATNSTSQ